MCIADIAISRRCYTKETVIQAATPVRFGANPDRIAIYMNVFVSGSQRSVFSMSSLDATSLQGIAAFTREGPSTSDVTAMLSQYMDFRSHPSMIHGDIWAYSTSAVTSVFEVIMQDELANELRQYLKEQRGKYGRK